MYSLPTVHRSPCPPAPNSKSTSPTSVIDALVTADEPIDTLTHHSNLKSIVTLQFTFGVHSMDWDECKITYLSL